MPTAGATEHITSNGPHGAPPKPTPGFVIIDSPQRTLVGGIIPCPPGVVELGRESRTAAGAPLDDPRISRRHAQVVVSLAGEVSLRDQESRNGTWVERQRWWQGPLVSDSLVRLGDTFLLFVTDVALYAPAIEPDDAAAKLGGISPNMREVRQLIREVAPGSFPVLLQGETGVGKSFVAKLIDDVCPRSSSFLALNCGAIAKNLAGSELFGHVRGAFTGAERDHAGYLEAAGEGTLFLDEIGELELSLQPLLLHAIEAPYTFRRVGKTENQTFRGRLIAGTNIDLGAAVAAGAFRADLYGRLNTAVIRIAPLRHRRADIGILARALATDRCRIAADVMHVLLTHPWPSNVRGLKGVMELLAQQGACIDELTLLAKRRIEEDLRFAAGSVAAPMPPAPPPPAPAAPQPVLPKDPEARRQFLLDGLERHGGNVTAFSASIGKRRTTVYRWMDAAGIPRRSQKS